MTANAEIVLEQFPDSLLVPEAAVDLRRRSATPFVDVVDAGAPTAAAAGCR